MIKVYLSLNAIQNKQAIFCLSSLCRMCVEKTERLNNEALFELLRFAKERSVVRCLEPYDRIIAIVNNMRVRDQEEKNKIFSIY